ncbi:type I polyketide synthase [Streptomyces sp. GS7]|uniref:type I polyketide synthase n=1 Tax=Streptomyces sp. GS7 TaxID=2692234 RepID=UPI0013165DA8|nr:type I polyketide synthase [Streptomyces sp. GS7]QHC23521.1 SDR family NAD(P)-dependent oxidoreductase [Streptomyces sp. GS7]
MMHDDSDAIAVVGVACRLPGGINDLDGLWTALVEGRDLIGEFPPERFDPGQWLDPVSWRPAKSYTLAGGYLDDIHHFDAGYFGMSPREAGRTDPQQRLFLEMAVEALDDAGIAAASLAGSDTAVYAGVSSPAFGVLQGLEGKSTDAYTMTGAAMSNVANRASHFLDLRGPSLAVDTACSSALVALHHACEALRTGRCGAALAGGVHVLLSPFEFVGFAKASMLSPTGRCRTFSAEADGYVRAEGGGLVVLKPLARALADGDRIHAVILGNGVNSDGRTPGLAQPSHEAQEALLREVYRTAGIDADEVAYLELHGTGTPIGDPTECRAVGAALGTRRASGRPLPVGSVKSQLGHLEPGSGMAGLFKAMLVLRHGLVPANLHALPLNPAIDFEGLRLAPATEARALRQPSDARAVAGVNSFGFGGANAHIILTTAPEPVREEPPSGPLPVVVSARTAEAAAGAAGRMARRLESCAEEEFYDLAYTSCLRRGHHLHRGAVLADTPGEAAALLRQLAAGERDIAAGSLAAAAERGSVAFAFSGNGSQWAGMGAGLLTADPVFRTAVEEADEALRPLLGWSVLEELTECRRGDSTDVVQPLLFAVQTGLVEMLRAHGVRPAGVVGHSAGEMAAAWAAGALDLEAAARVVVERSQAQASTAGDWGMAAVGTDERQARLLLEPYEGRLEIAGINSARDVTVSGDAAALARLGHELQQQGIFFQDLGLRYAFHSHAMDGLESRLFPALTDLKPQRAHTAYASATTGTVLNGPEMDAAYWWRNLRDTVLFAPAVAELRDRGCDIFVEVGPHPVLCSYLRRPAPGRPLTVVPTLSRDTCEATAVRTAVAHLVAAGDTGASFFPRPGRVVDLPAYPWERERHWNGDPGAWARRCGDGTVDHPLLGERAALADPSWHGSFDPARAPWLEGHRIADAVLMPAAGFTEMALAAGRRAWDHAVEISDLAIPRALVLPFDNDRQVQVQTTLSADDGLLRIASRGDGGDAWQEHARGRVRRLLEPQPQRVDIGHLAAGLPDHWTAEEFYELMKQVGVAYGPDFLVLTEDLRTDGTQSLTRYTAKADLSGYEAHPALLDGAVQTGLILLEELAVQGKPCLPASIDRVRAWRPLPAEGHFHARLRARSARESLLDLMVLDADGMVCLALEGVRLRQFTRSSATGAIRHVTVLRADCRPGQDPVGPSPLPDPAAIADKCREAVHEPEGGAHAVDASRELGAHFVTAAVAELLPGSEAGAFTTADLIDAGAAAPYVPLLEVLLDVARDHGLVVSDDRGWRIVRHGAPGERVRELTRRHPDLAVELTLLGTCGSRLPEVLRGRVEPADVLLSATNRPLLEELYAGGGMARFGTRALRAAVETVVANWPLDRPLRVLEVGAGSGGTTAAVLPALPPERTRYLCTDLSDSFFPRLRRQFGEYDFVDYEVLDLDADPIEQGLPEAGFDLVIAGHALHTAKDLRGSLDHIRRLLADGGGLFATEPHDPAAWALLSGLLPGFWDRHDTGLRPAGPLLSAEAWATVLSDSGFDAPATWGHPGSSLLLARRPHRTEPATRAAPTEETGTWIVASESPQDPLAEATVRHLGARRATPGTDPGAWSGLLDAHSGDVGVVLFLGGEDEHSRHLDTDRAVRRLAALRAVVTAAAQRSDVSLWLVTPPTGALPAPERPLASEAATLWGAARCLGAEHPQLAVRRIALERGDSPDTDAGRLAAELVGPTTEDEILLTPSGRFVPRIHARPTLTTGAPAPEGSCFALRLHSPGRTYRVVWEPAEPPAPAPDEVLVSVRAAALNYRDVLQALDLIPLSTARRGGAPGTGHGLGLECAGVVIAVGSRVTRFAVGDRVFGFGADMLGSHATVQETLTGHIPDGMDFCQATTLPGVYLTVHHSLHRLARLAPGESILVHGAAGGVGLATLQYAAHVGAQVIATAGTPAKRDLLRLLGVRHVLDSRSLDFAHQVKEITGGQGVDVVLNSLAGEAISRGLESLRSGGRFIELGKRDLYHNSRLPMRPFLNNLTLSAVGDIHELLTHHPDIAGVEGPEIARRVRNGIYGPILHHVYPADRITDAFEALQHSRHIGKVVVSLESPPHVPDPLPPVVLDREATYLVTGGLGGFGAATAQWLVRQGARRLALTGRRGADHPEAPALLDALHGRGVHVTVHAADAGDAAAMRAVLDHVDTRQHPLRGIVHAAATFDDGPLMDLTEERLRSVLAPKAGGAAVLDELTRDRDLAFFVLASSVTGMTGNLHQSSYVAANVFLEALARSRRRDGLPALAVGWGAVADVGHAARNDMTAYLRTIGMPPVPADELLRLFGSLPAEDDVAVLADIDWHRIQQIVPAAARFSTVLAKGHGARDGDENLASQLASATPESALALITDVLTRALAGVLQTTPDRLPPDRSLSDLGVDSLMGAELMGALQQRLGCNLPMLEIVNSTSIGDLARRCLHWLK